MGEKEWSCAPKRRYVPRSPSAISSSVAPGRTCSTSHCMASSFTREAARMSSALAGILEGARIVDRIGGDREGPTPHLPA